MRHSVCPLENRTSTRVGPLSCTSAMNPAAGLLDANETVLAPSKFTVIDPPAELYVGVSGRAGAVVGAGGGTSPVPDGPFAAVASLPVGVVACGAPVPPMAPVPPAVVTVGCGTVVTTLGTVRSGFVAGGTPHRAVTASGTAEGDRGSDYDHRDDARPRR